VILGRAFYRRPAALVARDLLGCVVFSHHGRAVTAGRIVETEAYLGPEDAASHAAFRPGSRALFYGDGGFAYVFPAYGLHVCLNAIVGPVGRPGCVLLRAVEPVTGVATMARRRGRAPDWRRLASGPGNLCRALGVTVAHNGCDLTRGPLTIGRGPAEGGIAVSCGPRVGITRAVNRRLRFWITDHPCVSKL
jgi:DNA-3-methyladenine glycosylase